MQRTDTNLPVVFITGAGRKGRVGEALAREFHARHYNVVIHYNEAKLEAWAFCKELNKIRDNSAITIQGDLGSQHFDLYVNQMMKEAGLHWGHLNVLINSASLFEMSVPGEMKLKKAARLMQVNAIAPLLLTQAFSQYLQQKPEQASGCVINISDVFASNPSAIHAEYNASKVALEKYTVDAAATFRNVRVVAVAPGAMLPPAGVSAGQDHFTGYEGTGLLIEKIFAIIADESLNGCTVRSVKGIDVYPENFFETPQLK